MPPQFLLKRGPATAGQGVLEMAMKLGQPGVRVKLSLDAGRGFNEEQSIYLPLKNGQAIKRLLYAPEALR